MNWKVTNSIFVKFFCALINNLACNWEQSVFLGKSLKIVQHISMNKFARILTSRSKRQLSK